MLDLATIPSPDPYPTDDCELPCERSYSHAEILVTLRRVRETID